MAQDLSSKAETDLGTEVLKGQVTTTPQERAFPFAVSKRDQFTNNNPSVPSSLCQVLG